MWLFCENDGLKVGSSLQKQVHNMKATEISEGSDAESIFEMIWKFYFFEYCKDYSTDGEFIRATPCHYMKTYHPYTNYPVTFQLGVYTLYLFINLESSSGGRKSPMWCLPTTSAAFVSLEASMYVFSISAWRALCSQVPWTDQFQNVD